MSVDELAKCLARLARTGVEELESELRRLERIPGSRTMTPAAERLWLGETLAEGIEKRRRRVASLEWIANALGGGLHEPGPGFSAGRT
jgi:hypothetical protein